MSHHSRTGSIVIASIVTLAVLLSACRGGSTGSEPEASTTPQAASTTTAATPERAPTSTPVPRSTPVPEATAPGPGRITAILQADCGLGAAGIQLSISYGGRAQGGTLVSHVFLQVDGDLEEDSGLLAQREYRTTKTIPAAYLDTGGLDHAYAMTIHKAQGMTRDVALTLADDTFYREAAYTALSRGRRENRLYLITDQPAREERHAPEFDDRAHAELVRRMLERSLAKTMALEHGTPERSRTPEQDYGIEIDL